MAYIEDFTGYYTSAQTNANFVSATTLSIYYTSAQTNANFLSANTSYYTQVQANANFLSATTQYTGRVIISNPITTAGSSGPVMRFTNASTLKAVHLLCPSNGTITGNLWLYDTSGLNGASCSAFDMTGLTSRNVDNGVLNNTYISGGTYVGWKTTSITSSPSRVEITWEYTTP